MIHQTPTTTTTLTPTAKGMYQVFHKGQKGALKLYVKRNLVDAIEVFNKLVTFATGDRNFVDQIQKNEPTIYIQKLRVSNIHNS